MKESSPITGSESLLVTGLPFESSLVPAGTMKSGRLPVGAGSRFGSEIGRGVPTKSGFGSSSLSGTLSSARAATRATQVRANTRMRFMEDGSGDDEVFGFELEALLRGDGFV